MLSCAHRGVILASSVYLGEVKVLVGVDDPEDEGNGREREEQAVDAVKDAAVPRNDVAGILDTNAALDH